MRCRLSPTADVPSHTSGAAMGPTTDVDISTDYPVGEREAPRDRILSALL
jgi:hypothetical protein